MINEPMRTVPMPNTDPRRDALERGLRQLDRAGLQRIAEALRRPDGVLLDHGNFDPITGRWCPLAVGLDFPDAWSGPPISTDAAAKEAILEVGRARFGEFSLNPIKGIRGAYFTDRRREDLTELVGELLSEATVKGHGRPPDHDQAAVTGPVRGPLARIA